MRSYIRTATSIVDEQASLSRKYNSGELQIVVEMLQLRALAMAEALGIMEGGDDMNRNGVEEAMEEFPHYKANIVAEVSDKNKNR